MLKRFIEAKNILINPESENKETLLKLMVNRAEELGYLRKDNQFYNDILAKDQSGVMELGPHIILPHVRADYINKLFVILAISKNGFQYKGAKKNLGHIVLLVGVPKEGNEYLKLLAGISRLMMREDFVQDLINSEIPDDVSYAIKKCEVQIERAEHLNAKKYLIILTINKSFKEDRVTALLAEVGVELPVEIEGRNLESASSFMPFLATFGLSSSLTKYSKTYMGISDEKDAADRLFGLLKETGLDLDENGTGSLVQIEVMNSYGGFAQDLDF